MIRHGELIALFLAAVFIAGLSVSQQQNIDELRLLISEAD